MQDSELSYLTQSNQQFIIEDQMDIQMIKKQKHNEMKKQQHFYEGFKTQIKNKKSVFNPNKLQMSERPIKVQQELGSIRQMQEMHQPKISQNFKKVIRNRACKEDKADGDQTQKQISEIRESLSSKDESFVCQICLRFASFTQQTKLCTCEHMFCEECLKLYVFYKITIWQQIKCPQQNCSSLLDQNSNFFMTLPQQVREKYKKLNKFYSALKNSNKRFCPNEKCNEVLTLRQNRYECQKCNKAYCINCFFQDHQGNCQDNLTEFFQNNLQYRKCSNCKIIVQRISGCNHMTCICGNQFCYLCGQNWSDQHLCRKIIEQLNRLKHQLIEAQRRYYQNMRCFFSCDRIIGKTTANILKFPLKLTLMLIYFIIFLFFVQVSGFWAVSIFCLLIVYGLIVGPFVYLHRVARDEGCLKMVLMLILFPIAMKNGLQWLMRQPCSNQSVGNFMCCFILTEKYWKDIFWRIWYL